MQFDNPTSKGCITKVALQGSLINQIIINKIDRIAIFLILLIFNVFINIYEKQV